MKIDKNFSKEVEDRSGQAIRLCYQCLKCFAGCPISPYMDFNPNSLIRMIRYGEKEKVLKSHAIWLCVSCMTCGTRCPNEIDMGAVMDTLREMAIEYGYGYTSEKNVVLLHEEFVRSIKMWGRSHEATMLAVYKLRSLDFLTDLVSGFKLIMKGKIPFLPRQIEGIEEVRDLVEKAKSK